MEKPQDAGDVRSGRCKGVLNQPPEVQTLHLPDSASEALMASVCFAIVFSKTSTCRRMQ
jgi:hypothetical protein